MMEQESKGLLRDLLEVLPELLMVVMVVLIAIVVFTTIIWGIARFVSP